MVEIKSIHVMQHSFMGIHMYMPGYPLYLLMSTKTILAPEMFDITCFQKDNHVAVILVSYRYGFEAILNGRVCAMNEVAKQHGVRLQMQGKEALMLCENKKEEA